MVGKFPGSSPCTGVKTQNFFKDGDQCAVVLCVQCTKDIKQNMNIAMRLSATATLGNCRTLFMCDYVFSEHKRLDNVNVILLETKEYID